LSSGTSAGLTAPQIQQLDVKKLGDGRADCKSGGISAMIIRYIHAALC